MHSIPESLQRAFAGGAQVLGSTVVLPAATGTRDAPFRCNGHLLPLAAPAPKGRRDQALVVTEVRLIQTVDVGRIDESDARVERGVDDANALVFGRAVLNREVHPAVSDGGNPRSAWTEAPAGDHGWVEQIKRGRAVS